MKYTNSRKRILTILIQAIPLVTQVRVNLTKEKICNIAFFNKGIKVNGRLCTKFDLGNGIYDVISTDVRIDNISNYKEVDLRSVNHINFMCDYLELNNDIRNALLFSYRELMKINTQAYLKVCISGRSNTFKIHNLDVKFPKVEKVIICQPKRAVRQVRIKVNMELYEQKVLGLR